MYTKYDDQNLFAKIIRGELPCNKVYEDERVIAFFDIHPAAPIHILILPKEKFISFDDFIHNAPPDYTHHFFTVVRTIAQEHNLHDSGFRIIANHGKDAVQTIPHFHLHLLGGNNLGPLLVSDTYHSH